MKFDDLDSKMRVYETAHDYCVPPGVYIVARVDGRNFTRLTKETQEFDAPYDERFRDGMVETTRQLMTCGFEIVYGYTQSDEISLLFRSNDNSFGRKTRKLNSILAGEASASLSLQLKCKAVFDSRISPLPNKELVVDYFRWRNEDAHRNGLNSHCYWLLRRQGSDAPSATKALMGKSVSEKNEMLFQGGINFNDIPNWQKRGMGLCWETYEKEGRNPRTGETNLTDRRRIKTDYDLPMRDEYSEFVTKLIDEA